MQDLRYAARSVRRNMAFATAATVTLSLAIAANTVMFSVLNAVLLRPLPYFAPERLAMLWTEDPTQNLREGRSALSNVAEWRRQSRSFEDLAVFDAVSTTLTGPDGAEQIAGASMTVNLLPLMGVQPVRGRVMTSDEVQEGERLVLISHRFWQARFGASDAAIGASVVLNGNSSRIVGVLPADFQIATLNADVWTAQRMFGSTAGDTSESGGTWFVLGRLRPGVTIAQAQSEMRIIAAGLNDRAPVAERNRGISVVPLTDQVVRPQSRLALWMLGGAVFLVFLIAAANVASLTLARGVAQVREITVRVALGASAARIVRQLLTESVLLGVLSGVFGAVLAWAGIRAIRAFGPANLARLNEVTLDLRVLGYALVLSLVGGMLVGLAPAMATFVRDLNVFRDAGGRGVAGGRSARRIRRGLVVAEFALAIVLLAGASLLVRSWWNVTSVDPGFRPERVLVMELSTPPGLDDPIHRSALYQGVLEQIRAVPGVDSAGMIGDLFIANSGERLVTVERNGATISEQIRLRRDEVSPDFFKALGSSLRSGRAFSSADLPSAPAVAIVNEAMARHLWPGEDPIGARIKLGAQNSTAPFYTIVGVVADMRRQGPEQEPLPQMFDSLAQNPPRSVDMLIRTTLDDPLAMTPALRAAVRRVVKDAPIYGVATLEEQMARYLVQRRFETSLLTGFAAVALLLAAVGIYGLLQYAIVTRTHEIGLRIAIGAQSTDIFRMIVSEGLTLSAIGIAIGLIGAAWLSDAASSLLFGVEANDPLTFLTVSLLLTAIAVVASYFPARRATRIDPVESLRET